MRTLGWMLWVVLTTVGWALAGAAGCGGDDGTGTGTDAGGMRADSGGGGGDSGPGGTDAGTRTDAGAGVDAGPGVDAGAGGTDAGMGTGTDAGGSGADAGPGGTDAGTLGTDAGSTGSVCGGFAGTSCPAGQFCDYTIADICGAADATGTCRVRPEICPDIFMPVCGCDGMTYSNECEAHAAGVAVASTGMCT